MAGKIGYVTAADIALNPELELGMYLIREIDHFAAANHTATVSNSSGDALFTRSNHNLSTNQTVEVDAAGHYQGHHKVEMLTSSTFKLRRIPDNTFISYGGAAVSVTYHPIGDNGFYIAQTGSHNEKNFSLGDAYTGSFHSTNHNADGTLKYVHGDKGNNYSGPVGKHLAWIFPDHHGVLATEDSNGKVIFTFAAGHNLKVGMRGRIKFSDNYEGYYYFEPAFTSGSRSATQFRIRENTTSDYVDYIADETVAFAIVPGTCYMTGVDWKNSDFEDPGCIFVPASAGGQINLRKPPESFNNFCIQIFGGAQNIKFAGAYDPLNSRGDIMYSGWDGGFEFRRGKFGVYFEHGNYITNNPTLYFASGTGFWLDNFEVANHDAGFSGSMAKNDAVTTPTMRVRATNGFIHNIGDGECVYWGETSVQSGGSPNTSHGMQIEIYNVQCAYSGAELYQIGQMVTGSFAKNFIGFSGNNARYVPFTIGQGQGMQARNQEGDVEISNFIIDGFNLYGIYSQSDHGSDAPAGGSITFKNCYVARGGQGLGVFFDGHNDTSLVYVFKDMFMKYIDELDESVFYGSQTADSDRLFWTTSDSHIVLNNLKVDSALSGHQLFEGIASNLNSPKVIRNQSVADIEYENSGWDWADPRDILLFLPVWGPSFHLSGLASQWIPYPAGKIFREKGFFYYLDEDMGDIGSVTNSGGHALITCQEYIGGVLTTKTHGLTTGDPINIRVGPYANTGLTAEVINTTTFKIRLSGTLVNYSSSVQLSYVFDVLEEVSDNYSLFTRLSWDSTGKCNMQGEYNPSATPIRSFPPEDFRVKKGTVYARAMMGIQPIAADPTRSRHRWKYCHDTGSNAPDTSVIQNLNVDTKKDQDVDLIKKLIGEGNWVRRESTPVDIDGDVGATRTEDFVRVT